MRSLFRQGRTVATGTVQRFFSTWTPRIVPQRRRRFIQDAPSVGYHGDDRWCRQSTIPDDEDCLSRLLGFGTKASSQIDFLGERGENSDVADCHSRNRSSRARWFGPKRGVCLYRRGAERNACQSTEYTRSSKLRGGPNYALGHLTRSVVHNGQGGTIQRIPPEVGNTETIIANDRCRTFEDQDNIKSPGGCAIDDFSSAKQTDPFLRSETLVNRNAHDGGSWSVGSSRIPTMRWKEIITHRREHETIIDSQSVKDTLGSVRTQPIRRETNKSTIPFVPSLVVVDVVRPRG
jgi:hypothetical protein